MFHVLRRRNGGDGSRPQLRCDMRQWNDAMVEARYGAVTRYLLSI